MLEGVPCAALGVAGEEPGELPGECALFLFLGVDRTVVGQG
jgi:hypothetical protein